MSDDHRPPDPSQELSQAVSTIEAVAAQMEQSQIAVDRFIGTLEKGEVNASVLAGLRIGLSLLDVVVWIKTSPAAVAKIRENLQEIDNPAAEEGAPAILDRLDDLEERIRRLESNWDSRRATLSKLTRVPE